LIDHAGNFLGAPDDFSGAEGTVDVH
jgi:hypothetical protein